jgi:hypothetical protein
MIKPKIEAKNLPRLVRRLERTTLYISEKSSSIAYQTAMYYLQEIRKAIITQNFPVSYMPLSDSWIERKGSDAFWINTGELAEDLVTTVPSVHKDHHGKSHYVLRFSPTTAEKIKYNDSLRPLFRLVFEEMREEMLDKGRKFIADVARMREGQW